MRRRFGILYLGEVHARTQLERCGYLKRRARADYLWALRVGASSNLYRTADHVRGDGDRARPRRWNYRDAVRVREPLDQIALRRKTHAPAIPERVRGLSAPCEAHHSVYSLNNCACITPGSQFAFSIRCPNLTSVLFANGRSRRGDCPLRALVCL